MTARLDRLDEDLRVLGLDPEDLFGAIELAGGAVSHLGDCLLSALAPEDPDAAGYYENRIDELEAISSRASSRIAAIAQGELEALGYPSSLVPAVADGWSPLDYGIADDPRDPSREILVLPPRWHRDVYRRGASRISGRFVVDLGAGLRVGTRPGERPRQASSPPSRATLLTRTADAWLFEVHGVARCEVGWALTHS